MGAATAPVTRLESALAHGKTPTSSVADIDINSCPPHRLRCRLRAADDGRCGQRPPNGTGACQAGQTSRAEDKLTRRAVSSRHAGGRAKILRRVAMESLRLLASPFASTLQISPPDTSRPHRPWSSDDVVRTVVHSLWTRVWSERMLRSNVLTTPHRTKPRSRLNLFVLPPSVGAHGLAAENQ
jgi:hypothetical protein